MFGKFFSQLKKRTAAPKNPSDGYFHWRDFRSSMANRGSGSSFATELTTYRDHLDHMLANHQGKFVVIKGKEVVGYYRKRSEAITAGYQRYGRSPVLIKQVVEKSLIHHVSGISS